MLRLPADLARLPALFDERSDPDFRTVFGILSRRSTWIDVAVTRIRLTTLDFDPGELRSLRRLRLLLAEVNAAMLDAEAHALLSGRREGRSLRHLGGLVDEGRIEIRAAPLGGWSPDFTVFGDRSGPRAVLLGFHLFQRPYPHRGPALGALHGARSALLAARRFEGAWGQAHDIRPAILGILERTGALEDAPGVAPDPPPPPPPSLRPGQSGRWPGGDAPPPLPSPRRRSQDPAEPQRRQGIPPPSTTPPGP